MRYFAYGSNMDRDQMAQRCPGASAYGAARLPGHRVAFVNDASGFDGGVATILSDAAHDVWGVLWEIDDAHLRSLDEWEAYPLAYDRVTMTVHAPDPVEALVYVANLTRSEQPSDRYFAGIERGVREHALPEEYAEQLRRWAKE